MTGSKPNRTGGFSPLVIIVVVLVGAVSLAGVMVLSAYAPELRSGNDGGAHALSRSATGYGALPRLLRKMNAPVMLSRGDLGPAAADSLLVLTPPPQPEPGGQGREIPHAGPTLIILPKWREGPLQGRPGWVATTGLLPAGTVIRALPMHLQDGTSLHEVTGETEIVLQRRNGSAFGASVRIENARSLGGDHWTSVVLDRTGRTVLAYSPGDNLYVLADADYLNTQGLRTLNGARTAIALLDIARPQGSPIVFDLTLHGFERTRSLVRLMLEPPLLGLTLVLAALAVFAGWQTAIRFGPARQSRRVVALGKRALADNTAGLVRLARREHHMATPYAQLVRMTVARAIGAPRGLDDAELDAFLDRVGQSVGATDTYTVLAENARTAKNPGDLIRVAGDLYRWTQEMTRARQ